MQREKQNKTFLEIFAFPVEKMNSISNLVQSTTFSIVFVVILFGLAGNLASFIVFSSEKMRKTVFSVYFRFLVISHSLVLLTCLYIELQLNIIQSQQSRKTKYSYLYNWTTVLNYVHDISSHVSEHLLVVVSIDRFISIKYPNRFSLIAKRSFQIAVSCSIVCCTIIAYIKKLAGTNININRIITSGVSTEEQGDITETWLANRTKKNVGGCNCTTQASGQNIYTFVLFNTPTISFALITTFSTATVLQILFGLQKSKMPPFTYKRRDVRFALVTIGFFIAHLFLTFPYQIGNTFPTLFVNYLTYQIFLIMNTINFSLSFYLNMCFNLNFRNILIYKCNKYLDIFH